MKRIMIYPGSFDPPTLGHEDIALRGALLCDELIVAVLDNAQKSHSMFSAEIRTAMLEELFRGRSDIRVLRYDGLLVDLCKRENAAAILRGIRDNADLGQELLMASVNRRIGEVETVFLPSRDDLVHVSSSVVREIASYGRSVDRLVPPCVAAYFSGQNSEV